MLGFKGQGGRAFGTTSNVRRSIFVETKEWRSRDEKNPGHTRGWRDSRNRCSCEPDGGGCSMASWLSRRPRYRRLGGRGHPWRRARSTKALLQLRVRTRLFRAVMLRPAGTDLGRMALARSPYRGMLLTKAAFNHNSGKGDLASGDAGLLSRPSDRRQMSGESGTAASSISGPVC
jgi:hypothetical protein